MIFTAFANTPVWGIIAIILFINAALFITFRIIPTITSMTHWIGLVMHIDEHLSSLDLEVNTLTHNTQIQPKPKKAHEEQATVNIHQAPITTTLQHNMA